MTKTILGIFSWSKESKYTKAGLILCSIGGINLLTELGRSIGAVPPVGIGISALLIRFLIAIVVTIILHEGLHAIALKTYGYPIRFGIGFRWWTGPIFMTKLTLTDDTFTVSRFRFVLLAPQVLTVTFFLLASLYPLSTETRHIIWLTAMFNLVGGAFDIYEFLWLRKFASHNIINENPDGLAVVSMETK